MPVNKEADESLRRWNWEFEGNQGGESRYFFREKEYTLIVTPSGNWRCSEPTVYEEHLVDEGSLDDLGEFLCDNQ